MMLQRLAWQDADTDTKIEMIRSAYEPGMSTADIARTIGGVTRNAIIGVYHRNPEELKLCPLNTTGRTKPKKVKDGTPRSYRPRRTSAPVVPPVTRRRVSVLQALPAETPEPEARMIPLLELTEKTCKWPIGDPKESGFGFCGNETRLSAPYCAHHLKRAWQPGRQK